MFRKSRLLAMALGAMALASQAAHADASRLGHAQILDIAKVAPNVTPGAMVSINPQPLPPRIQHDATGFGGMGPGSPVAINPQPLPPRR